eukprot:TRINITY_DN1999_c0_g2_i2.p1 TRINITY_DN1999_c0_g2~~TRINITY_DN1999_c0_g2_i2.p1  ORF type:complete len:450 (+),score=96.25 TRINITY_DN1999_c0_g2_i2:63-1412(+)
MWMQPSGHTSSQLQVTQQSQTQQQRPSYAYQPQTHYPLYTPEQHYYTYSNSNSDLQDDVNGYSSFKHIIPSYVDEQTDEHLIEEADGRITNLPADDTLVPLSSDGTPEPPRAGSGPWHGLDMSHMNMANLLTFHTYSHITALYLSYNRLTSLPSTLAHTLPSLTILDLSFNNFTTSQGLNCLGDLLHLEALSLYHNMLTDLPFTLGRLWGLKNLILDDNPLVVPPREILLQGIFPILGYLRDRMPPGPPPPNREFIPLSDAAASSKPAAKNAQSQDQGSSKNCFSVFCHNILAENYATAERHMYTPTWALAWDYRKGKLLQEMLRHSYDILCLQEVEHDHYHNFFEPELKSVQYTGIFKPKSRARTMDDWSKGQVDGCAIFYKRDRFTVLEEHLLEYQSHAMYKYKDFDSEALTRVISKDNVAVILVMKMTDTSDPQASIPFICSLSCC